MFCLFVRTALWIRGRIPRAKLELNYTFSERRNPRKAHKLRPKAEFSQARDNLRNLCVMSSSYNLSPFDEAHTHSVSNHPELIKVDAEREFYFRLFSSHWKVVKMQKNAIIN